MLTSSEMQDFGARKIESTPKVAPALRLLHDNFGLTHNQATGGNYYVPNRNHAVYLADFSTLYPLPMQPGMNLMARISELSQLIGTTVRSLHSLFERVDDSQIVPYLFINVLREYMGIDPQGKVEIPYSIKNLDITILKALGTMIPMSHFNSSLATRDSMGKLNQYESELKKQIAEG